VEEQPISGSSLLARSLAQFHIGRLCAACICVHPPRLLAPASMVCAAITQPEQHCAIYSFDAAPLTPEDPHIQH
jgi:hypothetical protein